MFRQVKSALFWYYLYKFRRKVVLIAFLLLVAFFANAIYVDIVEYLTLKEKLEYLEIALGVKWLIIIFNIVFSIYLLITLFKAEKNDNNEVKSSKKTKKDNTIEDDKKSPEMSSKFTKREETFLKRDLKSKADILVKR